MSPAALSFFSDPVRRAALAAAVAQLEGTPFFPNSEAPGRDGGIDCVHTLNWIYRTCEAIGWIEIPRSRMDAGQHADTSKLIEAFETWPQLTARFTCVWRQTTPDIESRRSLGEGGLLPGDALCFLAGKVPHHGAIMLEGGEIVHALRGNGVHRMELNAVVRGRHLLGHVAAVYRPLP